MAGSRRLRPRGRVMIGILATAALTLTGAPATAASPQTRTYPGSEPCATTLQACIDGADPGDTILLATNGRIDEDLDIRKSLVLRPKAGFHPVIGSADPLTPRDITVDDAGGSAVSVTLSGLRLDAAGVSVRFSSHAGDRFVLARSTIRHRSASNNDRAVRVDARVADVEATITGNVLRTTGAPIRLDLTTPVAATGLFRVVNNRTSTSQATNAYHGIEILTRGQSTAHVQVYGNVVRRAMGCDCGGSGAVAIVLLDESAPTIDVVGNTIDRTEGGESGTGIDVDRDAAAGGVLNLFDNAITNGSGAPFLLPDLAPSLVIRQGWNALHGNGEAPSWGGYAPATPPLIVAPGYVNAAAGDYRLRPTSPLRDRGETCTAGGLARTDAAGRFRVAGQRVDIGAYEHGATAAGTGVVRLGGSGPDTLAGTSGRDILCGLGGPDSLRGRAGKDVLAGGRGVDDVDARDGRAGDLADGGPGSDTCRTDPGDIRRSCP